MGKGALDLRNVACKEGRKAIVLSYSVKKGKRPLHSM